MAVTLQDLLIDPSLYLYEIEGNDVIFQVMTPDDLHKSIFLDGRIRSGGRPNFRVPIAQLVPAVESSGRRREQICWIFHVAQCGSTLLARALDLPGRSLVLREPAALRRLGVLAGTDPSLDPALSRLLPVVRDLLSKRWDAETPLVIKANVPVNFVAHQLMSLDPDGRAVLLHFPLAPYVAAILRTPGHVDWTERVYAEMQLAKSPACSASPPANVAQKAAALWLCQIMCFEKLLDDFAGAYSLNAATLFDEPAETISAAAGIFGIGLGEGEAKKIAAGELFHSYSKNPALDYDPEVRLAREAEALKRLEPEMAAAREWAQEAKAQFGLTDALARPLVGAPVPLL